MVWFLTSNIIPYHNRIFQKKLEFLEIFWAVGNRAQVVQFVPAPNIEFSTLTWAPLHKRRWTAAQWKWFFTAWPSQKCVQLHNCIVRIMFMPAAWSLLMSCVTWNTILYDYKKFRVQQFIRWWPYHYHKKHNISVVTHIWKSAVV